MKLDDGLDMEINVKEDDFEEVPDDDSVDVDSAPYNYSYDVNVKSEVNRTEIIKRPSNLQPNQTNESENDSDQVDMKDFSFSVVTNICILSLIYSIQEKLTKICPHILA